MRGPIHPDLWALAKVMGGASATEDTVLTPQECAEFRQAFEQMIERIETAVSVLKDGVPEVRPW